VASRQFNYVKKGSNQSHGNMIEARLSGLVLPYSSAVSRRAITPPDHD
jgi:hypothetical protein